LNSSGFSWMRGFYSGAYVVSVSLIEGGFRVYEEEIRFSVEGAPEDMQVEVLLCRDPACTERSLVFVRNEKMYIAYRCSVEEVSITADLTFPDNSSRQLMLPANLTVKQAGSYTIRVKASAEGYRNVTLTEYFAVLEKEPELPASREEAFSRLAVGLQGGGRRGRDHRGPRGYKPTPRGVRTSPSSTAEMGSLRRQGLPRLMMKGVSPTSSRLNRPANGASSPLGRGTRTT
jgi:hypothetical protein